MCVCIMYLHTYYVYVFMQSMGACVPHLIHMCVVCVDTDMFNMWSRPMWSS